MQLNAEKFLEKIKSTGLLRISRYQYMGDILNRILTATVERIGAKLTTEAREYFESVIALTALSKDATRIRQSLENLAKRKKSVALKSAYAQLDLLFQMSELHGRDPTSQEHSIEELAEGLSLFVHIYFNVTTSDPYGFNEVDEAGLSSGLYLRVLEDALILRKVAEAETLVDGYGYLATKVGKRVVIRTHDDMLERSIRYGFIQYQNANDLLTQESYQSHLDLPTYAEAAEITLASTKRRWLQLAIHPTPRYTLSVPGALPPRFRQTPFREDAVNVEVAAYNLFCMPDELLALNIKSGLPVEEARQAQRLVDFIRKIFWTALLKVHDIDEPIAMRSRIPVFEREELRRLFSLCVLPQFVDDVIEALTHPSDSRGFFDVQYRPILQVDERYVVPTNILGFSNIFRNLLQSSETRFAWPNDKDPVQVSLAETMQAAGFKVMAPLQTKHLGRTLDIDVFAMKGDTVYIFECKNPLHPGGAHELRRSLDYVKEAAVQLQRAVAALEDPKKQKELFQRLKWRRPNKLRIETCIMMGNRMLNGWTFQGHPVRSLREAVRMLRDGSVVVFDTKYRTQQLKRPTKADLDNFLSEDSFAVKTLRLMEPTRWNYGLGQSTLVFETFGLDLVKLSFSAESSMPRCELRAHPPRTRKRAKATRVRGKGAMHDAHKHAVYLDELAHWLQRPVRNVKHDVFRKQWRVPPAAGFGRQRPLRWMRSEIRVWFGLEPEFDFQTKTERKFKIAKARMNAAGYKAHLERQKNISAKA